MVERSAGSDVLTPEQQKRMDKYRHYEGKLNMDCPARCWGCNADQCCAEFSREDKEARRVCNCKEE